MAANGASRPLPCARRRSPDRTDGGHSALAVRTGLHAPDLPFARPIGTAQLCGAGPEPERAVKVSVHLMVTILFPRDPENDSHASMPSQTSSTFLLDAR